MIKRSLKKLLLVSSLWLPIGFYGLLSSKLSSQLESTTSPKITTFWDVRVKKVEEFCETHHKKATAIGKAKTIRNLLVLKERNLVWCPVYKAGTSAWMTYLVHLSKKSSTEKEKLIAKHPSSLELGRLVAPKMWTSSWNMWLTQHETTSRFIIVRHPFDRLVSAFREKLERKTPFYKMYGQEIVRIYRPEYLEKFGANSLSKINNYGAIIPVTEGKVRTPNLPTFWEFIQWFLRNHKSHANEHWYPMSDYCSVCSMNYNYILKFEHYAEENLEFMKSINFDQYLPQENNFHRVVNGNHQQDMSSTEITKLYFEVLSNDEILKLFEIYQSDFRLFGYSFTFRNVAYS